jgi:hypothetical protein
MAKVASNLMSQIDGLQRELNEAQRLGAADGETDQLRREIQGLQSQLAAELEDGVEPDVRRKGSEPLLRKPGQVLDAVGGLQGLFEDTPNWDPRTIEGKVWGIDNTGTLGWHFPSEMPGQGYTERGRRK